MNNQTNLMLGVSKVDITPTSPIPLAGFAHRSGNFQGVIKPLFARIFLFEQSGNHFLLVTADLLWWGQSLVTDLQKSIEEAWGIPSDHLFLHATHNHSGPQTSDKFVSSLGKYNPIYLEWLKIQIHKGIREATHNLEYVMVEVGKGLWSESINRRKVNNGICEMAPNSDGPNDQTVTVIKFSTFNNIPKGLLVHATCHATTTGDNFVSAEFPGVAMEQIENQYSNLSVVAGFFQGFCGNIRPALVKNGAFFRGDDSDVKRLGLSLFNEVNQVLKTQMKVIPAVAIKVFTKSINLPFLEIPDQVEIRNKQLNGGVYTEWAHALLDRGTRSEIQLNLSYIHLAENLCFLTANAEMVVEYGLAAKEIFGESLLPLGYTNGMIGYVPTEKQLAEGGYESSEAPYYFVFPSKFSTKVEVMIKKALLQIREEF